MKTATAILLLGIAANCTAADFKCWKAPRYEARAIPSEWLSPGSPGKNAGMALLDTANGPYFFSISEFEGRYGPPSAYFAIASKKARGQGYLIFDLPDGGSLAAVVYTPPGNGIGAFVQHDKNCKFVRLVK
jgi:hypothetical protein